MNCIESLSKISGKLLAISADSGKVMVNFVDFAATGKKMQRENEFWKTIRRLPEVCQ